MIKERRKTARRHLYEYFKIEKEKNHNNFGNLLDISTIGLRAKHSQEIDDGQTLDIIIKLPKELRAYELHMSIKKIWTKFLNEENIFESGFAICGIDQENTSKIKMTF